MLLTLYVQFVLIIDFKQRYNTEVVITRAVMKSWNPLKADTCCNSSVCGLLRATGVHEQQ